MKNVLFIFVTSSITASLENIELSQNILNIASQFDINDETHLSYSRISDNIEDLLNGKVFKEHIQLYDKTYDGYVRMRHHLNEIFLNTLNSIIALDKVLANNKRKNGNGKKHLMSIICEQTRCKLIKSPSVIDEKHVTFNDENDSDEVLINLANEHNELNKIVTGPKNNSLIHKIFRTEWPQRIIMNTITVNEILETARDRIMQKLMNFIKDSQIAPQGLSGFQISDLDRLRRAYQIKAITIEEIEKKLHDDYFGKDNQAVVKCHTLNYELILLPQWLYAEVVFEIQENRVYVSEMQS